jgi:two-component system sensor histidine kinase/response regulator
MLSSATRSGDVARCKELGIGAQLVKPVKQSELYDSIAEALGVSVPILSGVTENKTILAAAAPLRVLLAEDSLANQKLAIGLLTKWGHNVTLATNGREAVATATAGGQFDVVLMDVQMPEMDGFEATQKIRQFEQSAGQPRVPIVAMTAHAMKGDRERCFEAGMDAYISKPVRAAELSRTISQFLPGERPLAVPAEQPNAAAVAGPANARSPADIDWSVALENVGGDRDLLRSVAAAALDEWPMFVDQLRDAIQRHDQVTTRRVAHTFKNAFRTLGAADAYALADRMEAAAADEGAVFPLSELLDAVEAVSVRLTAFVGKPERV